MIDNKRKNTWLIYLLLHIILMVYSWGGILSKLAAGESFLSFQFCLFYGGVIFLLIVYAFVWQQVIKHLPLTTAFANKAVTVVWGLVWGTLIFHEQLSIGKIAGAILVISGVALYAFADDKEGTNG